MKAIKSRIDFEAIAGHGVLLLFLAAVVTLVALFGKQEADFQRSQAAIKQWHIDNPHDTRLVFNCVSPVDFKIDCSKPWLRK